MNGIIHGDFGTSATGRISVITSFVTRFPATVELTVAAMTIAIGLGIPLGVAAAKRQGSVFDNLATVLSLLGISIPIFFLGLLLSYIFGVWLHWLPTAGRLRSPAIQLQRRGHDVLPLGVARHRSRHPQVPRRREAPHPAGPRPRHDPARLRRPDHPLGRARGPERGLRPDRAGQGPAADRIDRRHVLRNAMLPISTVIGLQTGLLLGGAVLTETIFAWGGVGSWLYEAAVDKDFLVIQSGTLILATIFVLVNLTVDISYAYLNPRIRYS